MYTSIHHINSFLLDEKCCTTTSKFCIVMRRTMRGIYKTTSSITNRAKKYSAMCILDSGHPSAETDCCIQLNRKRFPVTPILAYNRACCNVKCCGAPLAKSTNCELWLFPSPICIGIKCCHRRLKLGLDQGKNIAITGTLLCTVSFYFHPTQELLTTFHVIKKKFDYTLCGSVQTFHIRILSHPEFKPCHPTSPHQLSPKLATLEGTKLIWLEHYQKKFYKSSFVIIQRATSLMTYRRWLACPVQVMPSVWSTVSAQNQKRVL